MDLQTFRTAAARRFSSVTLPDGQRVVIRSLTAREFAEYVTGYVRDEDGEYIAARGRLYAARLIQLCVCDDDRKPLYPQPVVDDSDVPSQIAADLDQAFVRLVSDAIQQLLAIPSAEDVAKNSPAGQTGSSQSGSDEASDSLPPSTSTD